MNKDFLKAGNHKKIISNYSSILDPIEIEKIISEAKSHTRLMYELGLDHYCFAKKAQKKQWRQRVSRLYYAGYNVSKAIRFECDGSFSTEVKDHSKVGDLPENFPDKATFLNEFKNLREDRNSADYDHLARKADLLKKPEEYEALVLSFLRHAHDHLANRGTILGAKP